MDRHDTTLNPSQPSRHRYRRRLLLACAGWTAIVTGSLLVEIRRENSNALDLAREEAIATVNRDILYRQWVSLQGGIYVRTPVSTPPNSSLKSPHPDRATTTGDTLTRVDPATMTRHVYELLSRQSGSQGKVVATNLMHAENAPDEWESSGLQAFTQGRPDTSSFVVVDGKRYLRYMRPIFIEKECLTCHTERGYRLGDAAGGISVRIPMRSYEALMQAEVNEILVGHAVLWLVGMFVAMIAFVQLRKAGLERDRMVVALKDSERQFRSMFEQNTTIMALTDPENGRIVEMNDAAARFYGYSREQLSQMFMHEIHQLPEELASQYRARALHQEQNIFEFLHHTASGDVRQVIVRTTPIVIAERTLLFSIIEDATERKRREEELRTILHTSIDGFWLIDDATNIIETNEAYCAMSGYSREEILQMSVSNLEAVERPEETHRHQEQVLLNGRDRFVTKHRRKDGSVFDAEISVTASPNRTGRNCVFIRDVSERLRAEQQLRASEEKFRGLFEGMNEGAFYQGPDGKLLDVNEAALALFGIPRDQFLGRTGDDPAWEVVKEDGSPAAAADYPSNRTMRTRKPAMNTVLGIKNPLRKEIVWVEINAFPVLHPETQTLEYVYVTLHDITQRKQLEEILRKSEERYQSFVHNSHEAIYCTEFDAPVDITLPVEEQIDRIYDNSYLGECNDAMAAMYGLSSREELIGKRMVDAHGGKNVEKNREVFRAFIRGGYATRDSETEEQTVDGKRKYFLSSDVGVVKDGHLLRIWGTATDVTERRRAESRLRESEENFRTFFETIGDMIVVGTTDGSILYANTALRTILGYDDLTGIQMLDLHPQDRRQEAEQIYAEMFRGERETHPLPVIKTDGSLVTVETRVWLGKWDGKECVFGIMKDLTPEIEEQQRFERLFRNNPMLMALTILPERTFVDVNEAFLETLGYTRDEVIGRRASELSLFVDKERHQQLAQELAATEHFKNQEMKTRRKDGTLIDGLFSGEVIRMHGKQYYLSIMTDITASKQMERALEDERMRLKNIIAGTDVGTWEWNVQTGQTIFNERWAEMLGYSLAELGATTIATWTSRVHPEDLPKAEAILERHFNRLNDHYECEHRLKHKDGRWIWIMDRGSVATWTPEGKPLLMFGTQTDITKRKEAETKLREQVEELIRWQRVTLGREDRIAELKQEVNDLMRKLGQPPPYSTSAEDEIYVR